MSANTATARQPAIAVLQYVLALGSNLENPIGQLHRCKDMLAEHYQIIQASSIYRSAAVTCDDIAQPEYYNAVLIVETTAAAQQLHSTTQGIEQAMGRVASRKWGERIIDIDVIAAADTTLHCRTLTIPHPAAHQRLFVLVPWLEVDANAVIPLHGSVRQLLRLQHSAIPVRVQEFLA